MMLEKDPRFSNWPQPCEPCLFWYGEGAFRPYYCEVKDHAPTGPCDSALVPHRRIMLGLPDVRVVDV